MALSRPTSFVTAAALAVALLVPPASAGASSRGPCRHLGVVATIRCAVERFGPVPGGLPHAIDVARCESGLYPGAISPDGKWLGLWQISWDEFRERGRRFTELWRSWIHPPRSPFRHRQSTLITIRFVHSVGSWSSWSCG